MPVDEPDADSPVESAAPRPAPPILDLTAEITELTEQIIACESVSGNERRLADAVESALLELGGLWVHRDGDTVIARTDTGADQRVVLAGHLDTVPLPSDPETRGAPGFRGTVPPQWMTAEGTPCGTPPAAGRAKDDVLYGRGATDMKGGVAVQLKLAADVAARLRTLTAAQSLARDVTWVFYDHEEVEASKSGLGRVLRTSPDLLAADFAVLLEPTHGAVEGGCNGTCRLRVTMPGVAAHSGRAWMGRNAIHATAPILAALEAYEPRTVDVDGLAYREGLNAVSISGGIAGNVIPDACTVEINYRFAPDKTEAQAQEHVRQVLRSAGIDEELTEVTDSSPGARPGLDHPAAQAFVAAVGGSPKPKYGWTDVARFSALGVPAVNFGPGDPLLAHTDDEHVTAEALRACYAAMHRWLS
ncbi:succinyl-diaminopimelate desuccinylase [Nesterenkonia sp. HG001]|uniref:succinyl-diaminopimelate desuccinylase n=1 Tax=Nesterenkonia sp. HG001 TaxID=2983207 RepID=UPI002AC628A5|nr:succinyl-diaminopimelate desuccinylase [Nesterenkonia sp. HG001]MDZ5076198.1 succinyl-diaminopimelate desuccinylase [Nesterenkonia sp. HG001]